MNDYIFLDKKKGICVIVCDCKDPSLSAELCSQATQAHGTDLVMVSDVPQKPVAPLLVVGDFKRPDRSRLALIGLMMSELSILELSAQTASYQITLPDLESLRAELTRKPDLWPPPETDSRPFYERFDRHKRTSPRKILPTRAAPK